MVWQFHQRMMFHYMLANWKGRANGKRLGVAAFENRQLVTAAIFITKSSL